MFKGKLTATAIRLVGEGEEEVVVEGDEGEEEEEEEQKMARTRGIARRRCEHGGVSRRPRKLGKRVDFQSGALNPWD